MRKPAATSSGAGAVCACGAALNAPTPITTPAIANTQPVQRATPCRFTRSSGPAILSGPPELRHRAVDLAARTVHTAERRVRHQGVPGIEHHPFTASRALGIVETLSRNPDDAEALIGRVLRLPLHCRVFDRRPPIINVELDEEIERRLFLIEMRAHRVGEIRVGQCRRLRAPATRRWPHGVLDDATGAELIGG